MAGIACCGLGECTVVTYHISNLGTVIEGVQMFYQNSNGSSDTLKHANGYKPKFKLDIHINIVQHFILIIILYIILPKGGPHVCERLFPFCVVGLAFE